MNIKWVFKPITFWWQAASEFEQTAKQMNNEYSTVVVLILFRFSCNLIILVWVVLLNQLSTTWSWLCMWVLLSCNWIKYFVSTTRNFRAWSLWIGWLTGRRRWQTGLWIPRTVVYVCITGEYRILSWLLGNRASLKPKQAVSSLTYLPHCYLCCGYQLHFQQGPSLYAIEIL